MSHEQIASESVDKICWCYHGLCLCSDHAKRTKAHMQACILAAIKQAVKEENDGCYEAVKNIAMCPGGSAARAHALGAIAARRQA